MPNRRRKSPMLTLPRRSDEAFEVLVDLVVDIQLDRMSSHMNWFSVELIAHFGVEDAFDFLSKHASKRVRVETVVERFGSHPRFTKTLKNNCNFQEYVEIQSSTGILDAVRKCYAEEYLLSGTSVQETAHLSGLSMRTIQRLRKRRE